MSNSMAVQMFLDAWKLRGPAVPDDEEDQPCPYCPRGRRCRCAEYDDGEARYDASKE